MHEAVRMKRRRLIRPIQPPGSAFTGFRFPPEVILIAVRWYLRYGLSYRDLEELLAEGTVALSRTTRRKTSGEPRIPY
jgi:IS6 family transposase